MNTVVSGALDRLHYEKDPCVKYDIGRKLWIYLHRSRSQEEFGKQPCACFLSRSVKIFNPQGSYKVLNVCSVLFLNLLCFEGKEHAKT